MSKITEYCKNEIFQKSPIENIIGDIVTLKGRGKNLTGTCPFCDKEKKFSVNTEKQIWKCFDCERGGTYASSFIMALKNINYLESLVYLAEKANVTLEYEQETKALPQKKPKKEIIVKGEEKKSFRDEQLAASGLLNVDQKYQKIVEGTIRDYTEIDRYTKGTINEKWEIVDGDDMILHYMDLNGKPMMYHPKKRAKDFPMFRIRWSNPAAHLDKNNKPIKYQSPYDSGSHLWINETIRKRFQNNAEFDTLYMTEGEKKADKATKHGLYSVGIGGINNIANNKQLPSEFQWIIKNCAVKKVVFIMDSDWNDISDNPDNPIDNRPKQFLAALRNFIDYFNTFNNLGMYLDLYFAYPKLEHGQKGIDDLLISVLKGKEHELLADFNTTMNDPNGIGTYINCKKISGFNEFKLKALFFLNNNQEFVDHHHDKIKDWPIFKLGKEKFRLSTKETNPDVEPGTLILAQPLALEEEYWEEKTTRSSGLQVFFNHTRCYRFLNNRRFGRYIVQDGITRYIQIDGNIVREVEPGQIKDYVTDFTENVLQKANLLEALYKGHRTYLGSESLSNLKFIKPHFHRSDKGLQYLYFAKSFWRITKDGIEEKNLNELNGHVWEDKLKDFEVNLKQPLIKVVSKRIEGTLKYSIEYPGKDEKGKAICESCHFASFLFNASNFYWEKNGGGYAKKKNPTKQFQALSSEEIEDITIHFISKCSAIGYLLHAYFDPGNAKAVIAMDGKLSEVGSSNGRSGKTLIGEALQFMVPTEKINGKRKDMAEDKFIFENVTDKTRLVFIDDTRVNFDLETFFPQIAGFWINEKKGGKRFTIDKEDSPKFYIPTNHAINGEGGSFEDRQFIIAFSDFYNTNYKPIDEHGLLFFDEWNADQWNLFYNFMGNCLQIYFEHGLVKSPMGLIEMRKLRQQIGENFLSWAEDYYDKEAVSGVDGQSNLNRLIDRNECTESFYAAFPEQRRYTNRRDFKKKLKLFCGYKNLIFNPGKPISDSQEWGGDFKRGGQEFFIVSDEKLQSTNATIN